MRRACGIAFGIFTHAVFFYTFYRVFRFLHADTVVSPAGSLWYDTLLAGQFGVLHSLLLHPTTRRRLEAWIPGPLYGCFFSLATCATLLVMFAGWGSAETTVWRLTGWPRLAVEAGYLSSWGMLFYSLCVSGLGYQTGFTPWWNWVRGRSAARREFRPRNIYMVLRHPVYLSFMASVWFNPVMTVDRLLLALVWSAYIFVGSWLKDERLAYFLGDTYRAYQEKVPGYPFMLLGPLARRERRDEPQVIPLPPAMTIADRKAA
jgi:protein-S-isoprenylcysteine O-methyltransferase Ste14